MSQQELFPSVTSTPEVNRKGAGDPLNRAISILDDLRYRGTLPVEVEEVRRLIDLSLRLMPT